MKSKSWLPMFVVTLVVAAAAGCNAILGTGYSVGATGDEGDGAPPGDGTVGSDGTARDSAAQDGCAATAPSSKAQFESACTGATCVPFDNATRNTLCDAGGTVCPPRCRS